MDTLAIAGKREKLQLKRRACLRQSGGAFLKAFNS